MATLQELFIDMINAKNPELNLTLADVDFANPVAHSSGIEGDTRNTAVTLTAKDSSPTFKGSKEYHFFRFNLTHPNGEDTPSAMISDLIQYWEDDTFVKNQFLRLIPNNKPEMEDLTVTRVTVDDKLHVKVTINPNLLKWTGAYVYEIENVKDNLAFRNGELNGFTE